SPQDLLDRLPKLLLDGLLHRHARMQDLALVAAFVERLLASGEAALQHHCQQVPGEVRPGLRWPLAIELLVDLNDRVANLGERAAARARGAITNLVVGELLARGELGLHLAHRRTAVRCVWSIRACSRTSRARLRARRACAQTASEPS